MLGCKLCYVVRTIPDVEELIDTCWDVNCIVTFNYIKIYIRINRYMLGCKYFREMGLTNVKNRINRYMLGCK